MTPQRRHSIDTRNTHVGGIHGEAKEWDRVVHVLACARPSWTLVAVTSSLSMLARQREPAVFWRPFLHADVLCPMLDGHRTAERRSLKHHRRVAAKLRDDPALLAAVRWEIWRQVR